MTNARTVLLSFAVAAICVGGIYAMGLPAGNGGNLDNARTQGVSCSNALERAPALDAVAVGEVAAFRGMDRALNVSELSFNDIKGARKNLAHYRGRHVLLNLWATWCPPCREEMPWLDDLEAKRGGDTFAVVPISIDIGEPEKPKAFYSDTGLEYLPFFHDGSMKVFEDLRGEGVAPGMPTTLLLDPDGCILGVLAGPAAWNSQDALNLVDAALGRTPEG